MSSGYDKRDGFAVGTKRLTPHEETIMESLFDEQVDHDNKEWYREQKELSMLKRLAFTKVVLFPAQWLLTVTLLGTTWAKNTAQMNGLYIKLITNKVNLKQFKKNLNELHKDLKDAFV